MARKRPAPRDLEVKRVRLGHTTTTHITGLELDGATCAAIVSELFDYAVEIEANGQADKLKVRITPSADGDRPLTESDDVQVVVSNGTGTGSFPTTLEVQTDPKSKDGQKVVTTSTTSKSGKSGATPAKKKPKPTKLKHTAFTLNTPKETRIEGADLEDAQDATIVGAKFVYDVEVKQKGNSGHVGVRVTAHTLVSAERAENDDPDNATAEQDQVTVTVTNGSDQGAFSTMVSVI